MSTSRSHLPFGVLNRTANPIVRLILRSPAHRLLSRQLLLITVRGRRSGRNHVFPTGYVESDGTLTIQVGSASRKRWWRNLADGAPVVLRLRGVDRHGLATVRGDEDTGVEVVIELESQRS